MKFNHARSLFRETFSRADSKSSYCGNLFFRPSLEYLEDRRLLSVSPQVAPAAVTPTTNSSLSGFVYVDSNNNGTEDSGELGILDAVVVLTGTPTGGGTVNLSTVADSTGHYSFANLQPGNYTITETQPTNYIEGKDQVGSQASGTITQTTTTNTIGNITLNSGVSGTHNDFGNVGFTLNNITKRSFMYPPLPIPTDPIDSLSISKVDNAGGSSITNTPGSVKLGQSLTYTLIVTNTGQGAQSGVTVADPDLTSVLTGDTWTATETGGASGFSASGSGNIDDTNVSLPIGSTVTYTITGTVISTATTSISNTAFVTPSGGTAIPATDTDNLPILTIVKSDNAGGSSNPSTVGNVSPNQSLTYTVVVSNTSSVNATGATIADATLTSVLTDDSWTATETGGASGFSASGTGNIDDTSVSLPAGSTVTYTITGTVISTAKTTISNTASVTPSGGTAINAVDTDNLPTITIVKSDNAGGSSNPSTVGNVSPNQTLIYTVVVSNTGPGNETGATIADATLTSVLASDTWTAVETGGASGFTASGSGNISQTGVSLPAGSKITYTITGKVISTATTSISNTASVTPSGGTAINAIDTDNLPTISIVKSDNAGGSSNPSTVGNVSPNQSLTYTVVVSNSGPGSETGATITDTDLTTVLIGDNWTAVQTGGATGFTASGSGNINQTGVNLPAGSKITYTITGKVISTATTSISNMASVTPSGGTAINAIDTDNLPTISIVKSDNAGGSSNPSTAGNVSPNQSLTYTVVVSNTGPGSETGATITDTDLTTVLTGDTWTAAATGGASGFATSGSGNINQTGVTLPAGSTVTYTIMGTVVSTAMTSISNTASVTPSGGTAIHAIDVDNLPSLSIVKSDNAGGSSNLSTVGNVVTGQTLTYTVVVSNAGPGSETGATIADADLTTVLTGDSWTAVATGGASGFATSGSGNINQTGVTLPAGSTVTYTITGPVATTAMTMISNTATVTPSGGSPIPAVDTDNLPTLKITKIDNVGGSSITDTTGSISDQQTLVYTITVTNTGPGDDPDATITDMIPSELSDDTWTASSTSVPAASGFATSGSGNINQTGVNLPAGSSIVYIVTGTFVLPDSDEQVTNISNTASVTAGESFVTATDNDDVVNLEINKSDNAVDSSVAPSQSLTYTVVVTNDGVGTVSNVTINDPLPADFTGASWTAANIGVGTATGFATSGTGSIAQTGVAMPPGSAITYTITGTVSSTATDMELLTNTASVIPNGGNAISSTVIDQVGIPSLTITKSDNAGGSSPSTIGNVNPGQSLTYTIVVSNTGDGPANNAVVTDTFPGVFGSSSYTTMVTGGATDNHPTGTGDIDDTVTLPAGSTITYKIIGTVSATATGTMSNKATATPTLGNAVSATDGDNLTELEIEKSDEIGGDSGLQTLNSNPAGTTGAEQEFSSLTYTVVVANAGPGKVTGATVTDNFPADFSLTSWSVTTTSGGATDSTSSGTGSISDTVTLPANSSITYTVIGTSNTFGPLANTATIAPPVGSSVSATDKDSISEEEIQAVPVGGILTSPATSGAAQANTAQANAAAVDTAMAGIGFRPLTQGAPAFGPVQFDAKDFRIGPLPMVVDAALAGGTGWRPSSQVSAAIDALLGGLGTVQIDQDSDAEPVHGSHRGH